MSTSPIPILQTKLHRPPVAPDVVTRPRLLDSLESGGGLPLTLVSAPAGYGKSTLVAQLLERASRASVWLTLDKRDNDLRTFLCYFIAALRTHCKDACNATLAQLHDAELPDVLYLATILLNDLNALAGDAIVVIDDLHSITTPEVYQVIEQFLNYPPAGIQLVLVTRLDPPLALAKLRAKGRMNEVRARDLTLSCSEVTTFFQMDDGPDVQAALLSKLHVRTEGWPAGVRLARLALHAGGDVTGFLRESADLPPDIYEYLANQVLGARTPELIACLERTSILDRLCSSLCEAVLGPEFTSSVPTFIDHLEQSGLMVVPLDAWGTWFRYHHLFQSFLRRRLASKTTRCELLVLYRRAAEWYASQGLIEEALAHYKLGQASDAAAALVSERVEQAMNDEQWVRMSMWLSGLPRPLIDAQPRLVLATAWWREYSTQSLDAHELGARAELLLQEDPAAPSAEALLAEVYALRTRLMFMQGDMPSAVEFGRRALAGLPASAESIRGYTHILMACGLQMGGQRSEALAFLTDARADTASGPVFRAKTLIARCFMEFFEMDLAGLEEAATSLAELANRHQLVESGTLSRYFRGHACFHADRLEDAKRWLQPAMEPRFQSRPLYDCGALFMLALVEEQRGHPERAGEIARRLLDRALAVRDPGLVSVGNALLAELALRVGDLLSVADWVDTADLGPLLPPFMFYEPRLTMVRALIALNRPGDKLRAAEILDTWLALANRLSGGYVHRIDGLLRRAYLRAQHAGDASEDLRTALSLARSRGLKRLLMPLSAVLGSLSKFLVPGDELTYYARNLARRERSSTSVRSAAGPLSSRELEVLQLMAERMTNKEIGQKLFISVGTVRRHAENIYRKLEVKGRREAVARGRALVLLSPKASAR